MSDKMGKEQKPYSLEERTYQFAKNCRTLNSELPSLVCNIEDGKQLIRSSGSVAANYIEANDSLGVRDKLFRMKISRKEVKESELWLKLLSDMNPSHRDNIVLLLKEARELRRILSSIIIRLS